MPTPRRVATAALLLGGAIGTLFTVGCAHYRAPPKGPPPAPTELSTSAAAVQGTFNIVHGSEMTDAALQPFADIKLKRSKIPALLKSINLKSIKMPYENNTLPECQSIGAAILALDLELGPDVDVKLAEKTLRDKGADATADALVEAVESTSTSFIPFRGLVRQVSGASGRDRRTAAAIQAGKLRRAYLKGIGQTLGCQPPAAPLPYKE